ncbi:hypothetical protein BIW11_06529, partial [Tropilaelaps mercedesae]
MSPRKMTPAKKKRAGELTTSFGREMLQRTTTSVASIKERTRQGLKRLASKGALRRKGIHGSSENVTAENGNAKPGAKSKRSISSNRSPAVKVFRPRSDENTPQRQQPQRKVKTCKGPKQRCDSQLERRRAPVSMSSALHE